MEIQVPRKTFWCNSHTDYQTQRSNNILYKFITALELNKVNIRHNTHQKVAFTGINIMTPNFTSTVRYHTFGCVSTINFQFKLFGYMNGIAMGVTHAEGITHDIM